MMVNARVATRLDSPTASSNRRQSSQLDQGARAAGRDRPRIPEPRNAEARGFAVQRLPPRQCPPVSRRSVSILLDAGESGVAR